MQPSDAAQVLWHDVIVARTVIGDRLHCILILMQASSVAEQLGMHLNSVDGVAHEVSCHAQKIGPPNCNIVVTIQLCSSLP